MSVNFIVWAKQRLAAHGFWPHTIGSADGKEFRDAVTAFEKARGLPADGTADSRVVEELRKEPQDLQIKGALHLSTGDAQMLNGVHPDLAKVYRHFIVNSSFKFQPRITCGVRTLEEQVKNVARGVSKTMKSRHIPQSNKSRMSEAIDLAPYIDGQPQWDWPYFHLMAAAMKASAKAVNVPIVWGGDWKTFKDGPHFELDRKVYK